MLNGFLYKWIDVSDWEFSRINEVTRRLASQGWELDGVVEARAEGSAAGGGLPGISLRFRRRAAA